VGRPTICRRWPSKAALAPAALDQGIAQISTPGTGSVREDLQAFQRDRVARMNLPAHRPAISGLVADSVAGPGPPAALAGWYLHRQARRERDTPAGDRPRRVPSGHGLRPGERPAAGAPFARAVVRGQPLEPRLADQAADLVLAGTRAGGMRTQQNSACGRGDRPASP
jgi:hypothetical protein